MHRFLPTGVPRSSAWIAAILAVLGCAGAALAQGATFRVRLSPALEAIDAPGRLVVYVVSGGSAIAEREQPASAPFFNDPQPMFGIDLAGLKPGETVVVDDAASSFPAPPSQLPSGAYRAQAVFDHRRENSSWRREPGNAFSEVVHFAVRPDMAPTVVDLELTRVVRPPVAWRVDGAQLVEVRSELLSAFRGHEVIVRAGVLLPLGFDPGRRYGALYEVPGFGGDHADALDRAIARARLRPEEPADDLESSVIHVVLDPEGPNGHTLFADSAVNGPCGRALVEELIPELERRFPLVARPEARLLRGHSSGGWSALHLVTTYPETFGACWSTAPDPVDFRRFGLVNLYEATNLYVSDKGREIPSYRLPRLVAMHIREENAMEEVIGPRNTSAQQWDSWLAVFGRAREDGTPADAYDPQTGVIDREAVDHMRAYDLADRLRRDPERLAPLFRERVRLVVGDDDSFYLDDAVAMLRDTLAGIPDASAPPGGRPGYIAIVRSADHSTVLGSNRVRGFRDQMLEHLRGAGLVPPPRASAGGAVPAGSAGVP